MSRDDHRGPIKPQPASRIPYRASRSRHRGPGALGLLACLLLAANVCSAAGDVQDRFAAANRLYEEGDFKAAVAAYDQLLQGGQASTALYFNLGNACFKSGRIGQAIAAYRQAECLSPRDPDVQANLKFARESVGDSAAAGERWSQRLRRLTVNEWTVLALGAGWIWLGLLTLREWRPGWRAALRGYTAASGVAAALLAGCLGLTLYDRLTQTTAVVVARDAAVRYGPLDQAKPAYMVHDGTELTVLDHTADWLEVSDSNHRTGWLPRVQVVVLPSS